MKLKKISKLRPFVPNVKCVIENAKGEDEVVYNINASPDEQIVLHLSIAGIEEKTFIAGNTAYHSDGELNHVTLPKYNRALIKHCKQIDNLEFGDTKITTGLQLVEHEPQEILNEIIQEAYYVIVGTHTTIEEAKKKILGESSEGEEHSEKEEKASE